MNHVQSRALIRHAVIRALALGIVLTCAPPSKAGESPGGIVVDSLWKGLGGEKAGLQPGDVVLNWESSTLRGTIHSPFELSHLRIEQGSLAPVKLTGLRGTRHFSWLLGRDYWGINARPILSSDLLILYREGNEVLSTGNAKQAEDRWKKAASLAKQAGDSDLSGWFLAYTAQRLGPAWGEYDEAYKAALEDSNKAGPVVRAEILKQWANGFQVRDDLGKAMDRYAESLAELNSLEPESLSVSSALKDIGQVEWLGGEFDKADEHLHHALAISAKLAPHSMPHVWNLICLGALAADRGDLAEAESLFRKALAIENVFFPKGSEFVLTLNNLATLAHRRGDLDRAEGYYLSALAAARKTKASQLTEVLTNLGECLLDQGRLERSQKYEMEALSILRKQSADPVLIASTLRNLGKLAEIRDDWSAAEQYYTNALALVERVSPIPQVTRRFLLGLARVAQARGDLALAEEYFRKALALIEKQSPTSLDYAETVADLAALLKEKQNLAASADAYERAITELEKRLKYAGGESDRSAYRAKHASYYQEYSEVLRVQGRLDLAFEVIERSRARSLFEMLTISQAMPHRGIDPALIARRHDIQGKLASTVEYRGRLLSKGNNQEELAKVDVELATLLDSSQEVEDTIRSQSPSYEALANPEILKISQIQGLLDQDTLLLEYSLNEKKSVVWAVTNDSVAAFEIPEKQVIDRVSRQVYQALASPSPNLSDKQLALASARLSDAVLKPLAGLLNRKRILIVADGGLHYIPFSVLPEPNAATPNKPLILGHEIIKLPSATVLAELRRQRGNRAPPTKMLAVLADPVFTASDDRVARDGVTRVQANLTSIRPQMPEELTRSVSDFHGKLSFSRLVYTRREARAALAGLPAQKIFRALDFDASRATAMSGKLAQYGTVHFATHGLVNNTHPELSGLVLSLVDRRGKAQNGFLQLRDIYNLDLPVDTVVLSACNTALGKEIDGEGVIGLTRGFMYAGATRVLSTLWRVNDSATSELMKSFYAKLHTKGLSPAAALRSAQIEMSRSGPWHSPRFWAGFEVQGDWR